MRAKTNEQKDRFVEPRPGVEFQDGKLYLFENSRITVIRGWPKPAAWRKSRKHPYWHHVRPRLSRGDFFLDENDVISSWVMVLRKRAEKGRIGTNDLQRILAARTIPLEGKLLPQSPITSKNKADFKCWDTARFLFYSSIPWAVREDISLFHDRHFHLLCLFAYSPGAQDLVESSPALAYMIASNWVFLGRRSQPMRTARSLIRCRQKTALRRLGFPFTEQMRRVVAKVIPGAVSIGALFRLRGLVQDAQTLKTLSHVPRINLPFLRVFLYEETRNVVSRRFLGEICRMQADFTNWRFPNLIQDTIFMRRQLRPRRLNSPIESVDSLEAEHDGLAQRFSLLERGRILDMTFPNAPFAFPDNDRLRLEPITTPKVLIEEGERMHHCCASFADQVDSGEMYFWRVLEPERATVAFSRDGTRGWRLLECRGFANRELSPGTIQTIRMAVAQTESSPDRPATGFWNEPDQEFIAKLADVPF